MSSSVWLGAELLIMALIVIFIGFCQAEFHRYTQLRIRLNAVLEQEAGAAQILEQRSVLHQIQASRKNIMLKKLVAPCCVIIVLFLIGYFLLFPEYGLRPLLIVALITCVVLYFAQRVYRAKMRRRFAAHFPNTIDSIVNRLKSGQIMPVIVKNLAYEKDVSSPLFLEVHQQVLFGVSFIEALYNVADRYNDPLFRFFATTLAVQQETGANVISVLQSLASELRKQVALRVKIYNLFIESKTSAWVLITLNPLVVLVIFLLSPNYFHTLIANPTGHNLVYESIALYLVGCFVIWNVTRIKG